jgi:hypothetical protein
MALQHICTTRHKAASDVQCTLTVFGLLVGLLLTRPVAATAAAAAAAFCTLWVLFDPCRN